MYLRKGMLKLMQKKRKISLAFGIVFVVIGIALILIGVLIYIVVQKNDKRLSPSFQEDTLITVAKEYMESTATVIVDQGPEAEIIYSLADLESLLSRSIKDLSKCDKDNTRVFIKYTDEDNIQYRVELDCENE